MKDLLKTALCCVAIFCTLSITESRGDDFDTIYHRMFEAHSGKPSDASVEAAIKSFGRNGALEGMDYGTDEGTPREHLVKMQTLAQGYTCPESRYFHSRKVLCTYTDALEFWVDTDQRPWNWWYRYICYTQELGSSVVLMAEPLRKDKELFGKAMDYFRATYDGTHMEGANGADIIRGAMFSTVLRKDRDEMLEYKERMSALMEIQPSEGVLRDWLFSAHSGSGRQLYVANYGKEFVLSCLCYLEYCKGTEYDLPGLEGLLRNLYVEGVQWIYFNRYYDPNNAGRFISSELYREHVMERGERLCRLSGNKDKELVKAVERIKGENSLEGNRMFWRFDYMVHRRSDYMTSARMTSTRTVGNEAGNGDGEFNYYSSNGVNYTMVTGKEYSGDFFKRFDCRQYPGTTAAQDTAALPIPEWGMEGGNGNAYAGGASDGKYGACGMILDRRGLNAFKGWFFFDGEYVCLGAGINEKRGEGPVYTTLNQTNLDGKVLYSNGNTISVADGRATSEDMDWALHGNIAYYNLSPDTKYLISAQDSLFSLNADHGISPECGCYAYAVKPDTGSAAEAMTGRPMVQIISNSTKVQAVRHPESCVTGVVFYEPGSIGLPDGREIAADAPCVLVWNEKTGTISVANPYCESVKYKKICITVTSDGKDKDIFVALPQGEYSGQTVILQIS